MGSVYLAIAATMIVSLVSVANRGYSLYAAGDTSNAAVFAGFGVFIVVFIIVLAILAIGNMRIQSHHRRAMDRLMLPQNIRKDDPPWKSHGWYDLSYKERIHLSEKYAVRRSELRRSGQRHH